MFGVGPANRHLRDVPLVDDLRSFRILSVDAEVGPELDHRRLPREERWQALLEARLEGSRKSVGRDVEHRLRRGDTDIAVEEGLPVSVQERAAKAAETVSVAAADLEGLLAAEHDRSKNPVPLLRFCDSLGGREIFIHVWGALSPCRPRISVL